MDVSGVEVVNRRILPDGFWQIGKTARERVENNAAHLGSSIRVHPRSSAVKNQADGKPATCPPVNRLRPVAFNRGWTQMDADFSVSLVARNAQAQKAARRVLQIGRVVELEPSVRERGQQGGA